MLKLAVLCAKTVDLVGVAGDAGNDLGVSGLHGARRAAQADDRRRAAHRDMVEPARRKPEMLSAHRRVRRQRKTRHAQAVDLVLGNSGAVHQLFERTRHEPVRATGSKSAHRAR
jgi:hypothetical protein